MTQGSTRQSPAPGRSKDLSEHLSYILPGTTGGWQEALCPAPGSQSCLQNTPAVQKACVQPDNQLVCICGVDL